MITVKYRLTVKGQVILTTLLLLIGLHVWTVVSTVEPVASKALKNESKMPAKSEIETVSQGNESGEAEVLVPLVEAEEKVEVKDEDLRVAAARVYFLADRWEVKGEELLKLTEIIAAAQKYNDQRIIIEGNINGYPDYKDSSFGKELSLKRAQVIATFLINQGIEKNRIIITNNGSKKPASESKDNIWMNRRADVHFEGYPVNKQ